MGIRIRAADYTDMGGQGAEGTLRRWGADSNSTANYTASRGEQGRTQRSVGSGLLSSMGEVGELPSICDEASEVVSIVEGTGDLAKDVHFFAGFEFGMGSLRLCCLLT